MWISPTAMLAYALIVSNGVNGWELRGAVSKEDRNLQYVVQIVSDKVPSACIQAKGEGVNSEVILAASCTSFRVDEDGLIRSFKAGVRLLASWERNGSPGRNQDERLSMQQYQ
jgi:hypothetical protein